MKTIIAVLCLVCVCPQLVRADTCNCAVTRICNCRADECECPSCPGNVSNRPIVVQHMPAVPAYVAVQRHAVIAVYTPAPVVQVVQAASTIPQATYYNQASSSCYRDTAGNWICPQNQQSQAAYVYRQSWMSGGDWRRVKRAVKNGNLIFE